MQNVQSCGSPGTSLKTTAVEGVSFPSLFHPNYLLSQKVLIRLDQYKFKLLVPLSILKDVCLGLRSLHVWHVYHPVSVEYQHTS